MRTPAAALLLMLLTSCASAPTGAEFRRSLGNASAPDALEKSRKVLTQHRYEVEREENTPQMIMVQSRWLRREPFADEKALGVTETETRVTVTGRFRLETEQGPLYGVDLAVERRVVMMGQEGWREGPGTKQYMAYAEEIRKDLQRELSMSTRRF